MAVVVNFKESPLCLIDRNSPDIAYHFGSWKGLKEFAEEQEKKQAQEAKKPQAASESKFIDGNKLTSVALSWVGKDFNPGQTEQCANFVRAMLKEAGFDIGVTSKPSDNYFPTGISYANGFAGDDIGKQIKAQVDLMPGDIVLFKNTYGDYPDGTITHVGIYTGNGYFIHRPTAAKPVILQKLEAYGCWKEGRRLYV